ncbi:MAG: SH3 domain-containing protein [Desulfobacteraceae bacterium]|nr:SH3 domain-containing protein [Desulfobacteraceae bacterium]
MKFLKIINTVFFLLLLCGAAGANERMAVKYDVVNVRSAADASASVLWKVEKYHPIIVVEKTKEWARFKDFEGDQGWVHKSVLDKTETIIVKANRCNVRSGPGTEHDIIFSVTKGIPFKVLEKKGRWVHVVHADGDKGWIFNTLIW